MNVRKFIAANARDALRKVKETLGNDAIILSNRGIPGGVEIMAVAARDMAMIVPTPVADGRRSKIVPRSRSPEDDYRVVLNSARARISQPSRQPVPQQQPSQAAPQVQRPPVAPAQSQRTAAPVNAGIPQKCRLRNLEIGRFGTPTVASQRPPAQNAQQGAPAPTQAAPQRRPEAEVVPMEVMDEIRSLRKIVEQHLAGFAWGEVARTEPVKTDILRQMLDAGFSPQFARDYVD
jgi:flagellar biosynthesis protein FlhF